jgi:hypothetical protein
MDVGAMVERVRHKVEVLDAVLDFPTDRAAAKALKIPRGTISKWRRQANFNNKRSLLTSLGGIPGPKCPLTHRGEKWDEHEGAVLTLFRCFPKWSDPQVVAGLNALGLTVPIEHVQKIRRVDKLRHGGHEPPDAEEAERLDGFAEEEFDETDLLDMILNRILMRFLEERPLRAMYLVTDMVLHQTGHGRELTRIARNIDLESEEVDIDAFDKGCRDLQQEALRLRKMLLTICSPAKEEGGPGAAKQ